MLVETLAQLAFDSGAERISIEVDAVNGGSTNAVIVTRFGQRGCNEGKEGHLLAVLAQPLVVQGNVGELDSKIVSLVDELRNYIVDAARVLPETDTKKRRDALKTAGEDASGGEGDETKQEGATPDSESLASGEAESL